MSLTRIFDVSQRSLATYQKALDVTAHNVANANNEDYSRQKVQFSSSNPDTIDNYSIGAGVQISQISRVRDEYLDKSIAENNAKYYSNDKKSNLLGRVEGMFLELTGTGVSDSINKFFNSWSELSNSPTSLTLRDNVVSSAKQLAQMVYDVNNNMDSMRNDLMSEFSSQVDELNRNLSSLYDINQKIAESKSSNIEINSLLDQRDKLVADISKLGNVTVQIDTNNTAKVTIGGIPANDSYGATEFKVGMEDNQLTIVNSRNSSAAILKGGELHAIADVYSNALPEAKNEFNSIIETLATAVNDIHSGGNTMTDPPQTGIDFFSEYENGNLVINSDILNDSANIAASLDATDGNGENANKIAELADQKLFGTQSISEKYSTLVTKIGSDKQLAENLADANGLILDQLTVRKNSVSAVSVDEEMTNILKFQRSYDASAKLIKVADDMLQTILNLV